MTLPVLWLNSLFLVHLSATLFMTGLIYFVQVVHYPLFAKVGTPYFMEYHHQHTFWTGFVVMAPMLTEALSAVALIWFRPPGVSSFFAWLGLILVGIIWLSTATQQVPQHNTLSQGFDMASYRILVSSNWVRTIAWSLRSALLLICLFGMLNKN